jgi:hypothetical protein
MCSKVLSLSKTACSGKCRAGGCASAPRVWVVAACEGMVTLLDKTPGGQLHPQQEGGKSVFSSLENFHHHMQKAQAEQAFDQLVLVGAAGDLAWAHSSLPPQVAQRITAEIKYPLLPQWFREAPTLPHLTQAISTILAN